MINEPAYTILRTASCEVTDYDAENYGESIAITERVNLRAREGILSYTINDGPEIRCGTDCLETAIAAHPALNEVRPNQLTSITAIPDVADLLPLLLVATGEWGEYGWSHVLEEHITETLVSSLPHDVYRVLLVNGERWRLWHTDIGDKFLPGSDSEVTLMTTWAFASVYEVAEMNSGHSHNTLGLVTPSVVIEIDAPDTDGIHPEEGSTELRIQRWDGESDSAADALARWVCNSPAALFFDDGGGTQVDPRAFVQLLVEASASEEHQASSNGEDLMESTGYDFGLSGRGEVTTFFKLMVNTTSEVLGLALEKISAEPEYRELIVAARDPQSPEAAAKAERLARLKDDYEIY